MMSSPLPLSFIVTYNLPTYSLGYKALYIVITFVVWSICCSFSLIHIRMVTSILQVGTVQVFIPLIKFLQCSLVSRCFLIILRYSFFIFSFISVYLMLSASNIPKYYMFTFLSVRIFTRFGSSVDFFLCRFPLFIISMAHFSMANSIPIYFQYLLTVSSSFPFFANSLMSSIYYVDDFSCDL